MSDSTVASSEAEMNWAFPIVDPGAKPLGARTVSYTHLTLPTNREV